MRSIQTNPMIFMSDRLSVAFSFSRRAHLLTTCKAGGGIPPVGRARALLTNCLSDSSPEGAGNVASEHSLCSRLYILQYQQNDEVAYCHPIPPPACENSARNKSFGYVPQLLRSYGYRIFGDTHFLFSKEKQKERTVKTNGNLSSGSKSSQPWYRKKRCCSFRLSELF